MTHMFSEPTRRLFLLKAVLPILLAFGLALGGAAWAIVWVADRTDQVSIARQHRLADLVVSQLQARVAHDQESVTVWDDAVVNVRNGDAEWMDANLGSWMHTYFGHDELYVLDAADRPIFGYVDEAVQQAASYDAIRAVAAPLAGELRARLRSGDAEGVTDRVLSIGASDIAVVRGRPAVVSAKPIISDSGEIEQEPGEEHIHIAVTYLDGAFLEELERDYLLDDISFAWQGSESPRDAATALVDRSGSPVGYLVWEPYLPGASALATAAPFLLAVTAALFAGLCFLLMVLRRRSLVLRESEAEVRHLASHDQLTGLPNRRQFERRLDQALKSLTTGGECLAVLYLDLDRFKEVNDTFGHTAGDELLCEFAERLRRFLRASDTIGRLGGDEFAILLRHTSSEAEVREICQQLVEMARHPFDIAETQVFVGVSIGAAMAPRDGTDRTELTRRADAAMYHAKRSGRSSYAVFDSEMFSGVNLRRDLERDLRLALEQGGQLQLHFQPQYATESSAISGVEALVRWEHPERGRISPEIFIPIAEEAGLIEAIGEWVLKEAIAKARDWPVETIAVNVSAVELSNPNFALRVTNILMAHEIDPRRLELEVTETAFASHSDACERNIAALRELGVRFALDDFGVGFSSLGRLHQFEVDRIKVDRSFVNGFGKSNGDEAIVQAIVSLAKAVGLRTTAEGVETDGQARYLAEIGCDELQGFLLSKPLPAEEIERLWSKKTKVARERRG